MRIQNSKLNNSFTRLFLGALLLAGVSMSLSARAQTAVDPFQSTGQLQNTPGSYNQTGQQTTNGQYNSTGQNQFQGIYNSAPVQSTNWTPFGSSTSQNNTATFGSASPSFKAGSVVVGSSASCASISYTSFSAMVQFVICVIVRYLVPIAFTLAVALFAYGIVMFIMNADNEESRQKGKQFMIWSILAIFVMVSVWGLVAVLGTTLGFNTFIPLLK